MENNFWKMDFDCKPVSTHPNGDQPIPDTTLFLRQHADFFRDFADAEHLSTVCSFHGWNGRI